MMDQNQLELHWQNNSLDQAALSLERERADAEAAGDKIKAALASNDLGVVCTQLNRHDKARQALEEAQRLFIELNDSAGQGRATGNLAQLEERSGNIEVAGALFMQAADLLHEGSAFGDEFTTRRRLSRFYLARGATLQALAESVKALSVKPDANLFDKFQRRMYSVPLKFLGFTP